MNQFDATALARTRYNRAARFYDIVDALSDGMFQAGRQTLWEEARGEILEVGVGTGKNFPYYPQDGRVVGIDFAARMLARANARARELDTRVILQECDVQQLNFADNTFDTAVATCVFCSVPDPVQGLRELNRVVKPDGKILLLEHVRIDQPLIGRFLDLLNPFIVRLWGANINRRTIENVNRAGLEIISIENLEPMHMVKFIIARPNKTAERESSREMDWST